jgi:ParB family transcriptional regulator, chromosome partitioning protein
VPKLNPKIKSIDDLLRVNAEIQSQPLLEQEQSEPASPTADSKNSIAFLPPDSIRAFKNHPFHLYEGERLDDLVASVKANGILTPVIIRKTEPDENGCEYEMLAGHNRQHAAQLAGLDKIPCIVKVNLSDEDAWIYVVETNVLQRSFTDMLPSEKAAVLALRYSKMFSQGKRNDIVEELKKLENPDYIRENRTSSQIETKCRSDEKLAGEYGLSRMAVARLLRVQKLSPALTKRMDTGEIPIYISVEISYLSPDEQQMVEDVLKENEYKVDLKKAETLRSYVGKLTSETADEILSGKKFKKPKSDKPQPFKLKATIYTKYFAPGTKSADMEHIIDEALALYFKDAEDNPSA